MMDLNVLYKNLVDEYLKLTLDFVSLSISLILEKLDLPFSSNFTNQIAVPYSSDSSKKVSIAVRLLV